MDIDFPSRLILNFDYITYIYLNKSVNNYLHSKLVSFIYCDIILYQCRTLL